MKLGRNDIFCLINISLTQKAYRLEISGPGLRFVVIYMKTVRIQTGTRVSRLGLTTETNLKKRDTVMR